MTSLYDTLDVEPDADAETIKKAYRKKAQASHPDRPEGDAEVFHAIQKAYDILGDETKRKRYDESGATDTPPSQEQVAESWILAVFDGLLSTLDESQDYVQAAIKHIRVEHINLEQQIRVANGKIHKLTKLSGRVKAKKTNLFQNLLDQKISQFKQDIETKESQRELCKIALAMLEDYKDDAPQGNPSNSWRSIWPDQFSPNNS